jgi:hypothetical protein
MRQRDDGTMIPSMERLTRPIEREIQRKAYCGTTGRLEVICNQAGCRVCGLAPTSQTWGWGQGRTARFREFAPHLDKFCKLCEFTIPLQRACAEQIIKAAACQRVSRNLAQYRGARGDQSWSSFI